MMFRLLLVTASLISSALMPLTAHAYMSPEEVMDSEDFSTRFVAPPPNRRAAEAAVEEQNKRSAEQRAKNSPEMEVTHGAATETDETDSPFSESDIDALIKALEQQNGGGQAVDTTSDDEPLTDQEKRDARLLERLHENQQTQSDAERFQAWLSTQSTDSGKTLHSGAPLSDTGPATVLVTLAIAAAIGETWRRVRQAEKKAL